MDAITTSKRLSYIIIKSQSYWMKLMKKIATLPGGLRPFLFLNGFPTLFEPRFGAEVVVKVPVTEKSLWVSLFIAKGAPNG